MNKCVIYTKAKNERHHDVQRATCEHYAASYGIEITSVTRDLDTAVSALDADTVLLVYEYDRLGRGMEGARDVLQRVEERDSRVQSANDLYITNHDEFRELLQIHEQIISLGRR